MIKPRNTDGLGLWKRRKDYGERHVDSLVSNGVQQRSRSRGWLPSRSVAYVRGGERCRNAKKAWVVIVTNSWRG